MVNFGLYESDISVTDNILAGGNCNQHRVQAPAGLFYIASIKTMKHCFQVKLWWSFRHKSKKADVTHLSLKHGKRSVYPNTCKWKCSKCLFHRAIGRCCCVSLALCMKLIHHTVFICNCQAPPNFFLPIL